LVDVATRLEGQEIGYDYYGGILVHQRASEFVTHRLFSEEAFVMAATIT
jgi:hypothetical protein